jgi:hypothetical protein
VTRVLILVEGSSERIFVERTLIPFLRKRGVYMQKPVDQRGVSKWKEIRRNIELLARDSDVWITTLFDFYGWPSDFPGYAEIRSSGDPRTQVIALQNRFAAEFKHPRLLPFFALHEFESWLFSAPKIVAEHFGQPRLAKKMDAAVKKAGEPELIDHGVNTHPKARIKGFDVGYKEASDGPILLEKIGIEAIRDACPHFSSWLDRLQALGSGAAPFDGLWDAEA